MLARIAVTLLADLGVCVLVGCSGTSGTGSGQSSAVTADQMSQELTKTAEKDGVSFSISPNWSNTLNEKIGSVEPSTINNITVDTVTGGAAEGLESVKNVNGISLPGEVKDYQEDGSFGIAGEPPSPTTPASLKMAMNIALP